MRTLNVIEGKLESKYMGKTNHICPLCKRKMLLAQTTKTITFREEILTIQFYEYFCVDCNLHVGTIEQTAAVQAKIARAYEEKTKNGG